MSVTYTNRKGVTDHLCRGTTKSGKRGLDAAIEMEQPQSAEAHDNRRVSKTS